MKKNKKNVCKRDKKRYPIFTCFWCIDYIIDINYMVVILCHRFQYSTGMLFFWYLFGIN